MHKSKIHWGGKKKVRFRKNSTGYIIGFVLEGSKLQSHSQFHCEAACWHFTAPCPEAWSSREPQPQRKVRLASPCCLRFPSLPSPPPQAAGHTQKQHHSPLLPF